MLCVLGMAMNSLLKRGAVGQDDLTVRGGFAGLRAAKYFCIVRSPYFLFTVCFEETVKIYSCDSFKTQVSLPLIV